ncbi:SRPBCC family protein [Kineosporia succinea]|uniref:Polyketide cyclase/dehydrase/lipid transport protein n=1 Tax=Kineosporia succinea TaxID=84632 RepID=A0ABT9NZ90_9ACTN|nr:hypothetical protein [Kineosporia succinea]MDP9825761.1 hypothetical protein [Kineosporia succinea]
MAIDSRHVSTRIDRPFGEVYAYASDPAHLPDWAPGLCDSIEPKGDEWVVSSPMGRAWVKFAPKNDFGVIDHWVTLEDGQTFYNPFRVLAFDRASSEVVFSVRRAEGVTDEEFARDTEAVAADLERLKGLLEQ